MKILTVLALALGIPAAHATKPMPCIQGKWLPAKPASRLNEKLELTLEISSACATTQAAQVALKIPKQVRQLSGDDVWMISGLKQDEKRSFPLIFKVTQPGEFTIGAAVKTIETGQISGALLRVHATRDKVTTKRD